MSRSCRTFACIAFLSAGGCAPIAAMPSEREVPVQDILTSALCELRVAFIRLSDKTLYPNFKAGEWAAAVSLTPKVDTDLDLRFSLTEKSTTALKQSNLIIWTLGSPGTEIDLKTHRDGSVSYTFHTSELLKPNPQADRECSERSRFAHSLAQYHGIYEWWARLVPVQGSSIAGLTNPDKPSFNSNINIKLAVGPAGPTWMILKGSKVFSIGGSKTIDLTLLMSFTPDPPKGKKVVTLPEGGLKQNGPAQKALSVSPEARSRLDAIETENILRNLRVNPQ